MPRVRLAQLPTPLHAAPRLSDVLGVEVWLKRDDLTGVGLGGNKVRGLEFLLADALRQSCDVVVTGGAQQSNWAMLAALTARMHGLDALLVHVGDSPAVATATSAAATCWRVPRCASPATTTARRSTGPSTSRARSCARRAAAPTACTAAAPTGWAHSATSPPGPSSRCSSATAAWRPARSGSRPDRAARRRPAAAQAWQEWPFEVVGVTVSRPAPEAVARVSDIAAATAVLAGTPAPSSPPRVVEGFLGPAKGHRSPEGDRAAELVARTEGVLLDPVFAAKAMAALVAQCRDGLVVAPVVFLVTGGAPTLFA
jgi:D-cysteine desulfhydrase